MRARFETLNHDLRERILQADESDRRVLDDVFRGVDLIEAFDEGQTFSGFAALVRDLRTSSRDVHLVLTEFARGRLRYVYSQDFQRGRVLRDFLQATLVAASGASVGLRREG